MTEVKLSERELTVLKAYGESLEDEEEGSAVYMDFIAKKTKLTKKQVKRAVRSLARKGLTELLRGLFDEDGMVAGSGYALTRAGIAYLEKVQP